MYIIIMYNLYNRNRTKHKKNKGSHNALSAVPTPKLFYVIKSLINFIIMSSRFPFPFFPLRFLQYLL